MSFIIMTLYLAHAICFRETFQDSGQPLEAIQCTVPPLHRYPNYHPDMN